MRPVEVIEARRDRRGNTAEELEFIANQAAQIARSEHATMADYQLSAWLMAAYLNPLSKQETVDLTLAMARSGQRLDLSSVPKPWVDKHSTGGVGDKTTLVALPVLAACGAYLMKMSGRGLGITGGTIDKLASIPGFRSDLPLDQAIGQCREIGLALVSSGPQLAPADKELYRLRDVTGTVESLPLIASSILSKKLAGGAQFVVFDVKAGSGAFMKTPEAARELANWLVDIGNELGMKTMATVTDMSQPLGCAVGNALEVKEAGEVLCGKKGRFYDLVCALCGETLWACGVAESADLGEKLAKEALESGSALEKAKQWVSAQGGNPEVWEDHSLLSKPKIVRNVVSDRSGWVSEVNARIVGEEAVKLGAGRSRVEDEIDFSVGFEVLAEVGRRVQKGETLLKIFAKSESDADSAELNLRAAIKFSDDPVERIPVILG